MAHYIHAARKRRLTKKSFQTKWAPFWTVFKAYGKGKRVHPSRHTYIKRNWKRTATKV